jgi:hypothetical protein
VSAFIQPSNLDLALQIVGILGGIAGALGFFWGLYEYRQTQKVKRQQLLFELIETFDNEKHKMYRAKRILDDFTITPESPSWHHNESELWYRQKNLSTMLRDHKEISILDPGENQIRESFDALLDFFGKLEYLVEIGLMTRSELDYFEYFLRKAAENEDVIKYTQIYKFPLYKKIVKRYKIE